MKSIGVFCGARGGEGTAYLEAARDVGALLAEEGITLVYGGGHVGMMGVMADAALAAGGRVIGVIPRDLQESELAHAGVTTMHVVDGMHERKALMGALSEAFLALPGGFGTMEELFEVLTWAQLGFQEKPSCLVNVSGFFDSLLRHADHAVREGFLSPADRGLLRVASTAREALVNLRGALT